MALPPNWQQWIAENLALGVPEATLVGVLLREGFDSAQVRAAVASAAIDPQRLLAARLSRRLQKLAWVLDVQERCRALRPWPIERARRPSRQEFLERWYSQNHPVILTGVIDDWPALRSWTPGYLRRMLGHHLVEIQADRARDPDYERNSIAHKKMVPFAELVDAAFGGASNDRYMTANNADKNAAFLRDAFAEVRMPAGYFTPEWSGRAFLWLGAAGTVTPLHHDLTNNAMAQVVGRKRVKLVSPLQSALVYNSRHCFSEVDPEAVDAARFPLFAKAQVQEVLLEPGELLFLPVGWWHHVRALDPSITVSMTNFVFDNDYTAGYELLYGDL
ncbi:MAG TPA: cupin-like domain-containing protein [Myxococcales bacterium]|nr:cupin-like domain-containing protein [Myxococcales bacterium]